MEKDAGEGKGLGEGDFVGRKRPSENQFLPEVGNALEFLPRQGHINTEQSVFEGVAGGTSFAGGGDGSAGFGSIGAGDDALAPGTGQGFSPWGSGGLGGRGEPENLRWRVVCFQRLLGFVWQICTFGHLDFRGNPAGERLWVNSGHVQPHYGTRRWRFGLIWL